jgi:integrase
MRTREQKGYVWKKGNSWFVRYWDSTVEGGSLVRKQRSFRLASVEKEHQRLTKRIPDYVLKLAEDHLRPLNSSSYDPSKNVTFGDFAKKVWLSHIEGRHAASTVHSHRYYWENILAPHCSRTQLREFSTPMAQKLLDEIARQNPGMKKATLHKLKSMLSAIFKLAIQQDYRPGPNPIRETSLPRAPEAQETVAYDLDTVLAMLQVVPEPSRTVIAIAAFAGLRRGEIEGLTWESYSGETLSVLRAMWQGIAGEPKTKKSKAAVPVITALSKFLDQHRLRSANPEAGIMFPTRNGTPLSMNNLLNDQIQPALEKAGIAWSGFHAFRRGLATNLHDLGVDDLTIQRILRHSDVSVTQRCYIKTLPAQSIAAMNKLDMLIDHSSLTCNDCATPVAESKLVQ